MLEKEIECSIFYKYQNENGDKYKIIRELEPKGKTKIRQFAVKFKNSKNLMESSITSILNGKIKDIEMQKKQTVKKRRQVKKQFKSNKYAQKSTMSKENAKRLLTLDISSKSTGWAIFIDYKLVDYGFIYQSPSHPVTVRLNGMKVGILDLIEKYDITGVVIEDVLQLHKIPLSVLSKAQGIILDNLFEMDTDWCILPVNDWKAKMELYKYSHIKGKNSREESKLRTVARVKDLFDVNLDKFKTPSDLKETVIFDVCDAISLGYVLINFNMK